MIRKISRIVCRKDFHPHGDDGGDAVFILRIG
jgi:hypothetical protein